MPSTVTAAPVAAATSLDAGLLSKIHAFVESARSVAADGLTWVEFGELTLALLRLVVTGLDQVRVMTGAEKKSVALEAVGSLFDAVADKAVPATVWPLWILVKPAIRSLVLAIASGAVEQVLVLVRA